jgi:hypothetical protein
VIKPSASVLELVVAAQTDPIVVLRIAQSRLIAARDLALIDFDEYRAAEQIQETRAILGAVADALKAHALSPPWPRPSRKAVNAAVKAYEQDAADANAASPEPSTSPAWQAL